MSILYLASDPRSLADTLADELDRHSKEGDFFVPTTIVVPNRYLRKWLRLWLARRLKIAINLKFEYLEDALWQLLQKVDPRRASSPAEPIDKNIYRLMVLSVLLQEKEPPLRPPQALSAGGGADTYSAFLPARLVSRRPPRLAPAKLRIRSSGWADPTLAQERGRPG